MQKSFWFSELFGVWSSSSLWACIWLWIQKLMSPNFQSYLIRCWHFNNYFLLLIFFRAFQQLYLLPLYIWAVNVFVWKQGIIFFLNHVYSLHFKMHIKIIVWECTVTHTHTHTWAVKCSQLITEEISTACDDKNKQ